MTTKTDGNPVIEKSSDSSVFIRVGGNRNLNNAHINRLEEAISEDAQVIKYNPILINEKWEVIDGQHRLEAIKRLNLPVYYIQVEGLDLKDAQALNKLAKPWSPMDYAKSYAEMGNQNYEFYIELKHLYGLNHDVLMRYISLDEPITGEMFRAGKMKAVDKPYTTYLCEALVGIGEFYPRYKSRSFALAFKTVYDSPKYDHERLLRKLSDRPNAIQDRALPLDYIRDLEAIFNHGLSEKVRFI